MIVREKYIPCSIHLYLNLIFGMFFSINEIDFFTEYKAFKPGICYTKPFLKLGYLYGGFINSGTQAFASNRTCT